MQHVIMKGILAVLLLLLAPHAGAAEPKTQSAHRSLQGMVVEKGGALAVKVPDGTTYQLNENRAHRHGHDLPKVGDEVTVIIDENNMVLEVHPPGTRGAHRYITGEVISIGIPEKIIKLRTSEGEQSFPLEKLEMTGSIKDGARVKAELNEAGSVIDLHPAQ
ncbi:hypothetical protein W02_11720 [Nitrospira sp. KM1]|uniref:hypothetical protein n=1 Tax=Nitrospira sp. KM1 TaxID=1936990 RepID=UPI0013A771A6|nr:hypothetical protein [Nitrospira sp. KM1]BCA54032.1 hypothetical protein W02_11720 [Nitrospira sp. KM1]